MNPPSVVTLRRRVASVGDGAGSVDGGLDGAVVGPGLEVDGDAFGAPVDSRAAGGDRQGQEGCCNEGERAADPHGHRSPG